VPKRTFAAIVQRTELWDPGRAAHEQDGFAAHAAFVAGLEADGFIALAGLMQPSTDVLFIFLADSAEEVHQRMRQDPWQQDGHARLIRVEEIHIRIGAPKQDN
jgi:uncharacterized protein YciI